MGGRSWERNNLALFVGLPRVTRRIIHQSCLERHCVVFTSEGPPRASKLLVTLFPSLPASHFLQAEPLHPISPRVFINLSTLSFRLLPPQPHSSSLRRPLTQATISTVQCSVPLHSTKRANTTCLRILESASNWHCRTCLLATTIHSILYHTSKHVRTSFITSSLENR